MRLVFAVLLALPLLPAAPAFAQQPFVLPGAAVPQGETLFVVEDTETQRFYDNAEAKGVQLIAREAVTVITRHEGLVRVFVKGRYGWVAEAKLTAELPPIAPPAGQVPPLLPQ